MLQPIAAVSDALSKPHLSIPIATGRNHGAARSPVPRVVKQNGGNRHSNQAKLRRSTSSLRPCGSNGVGYTTDWTRRSQRQRCLTPARFLKDASHTRMGLVIRLFRGLSEISSAPTRVYSAWYLVAVNAANLIQPLHLDSKDDASTEESGLRHVVSYCPRSFSFSCGRQWAHDAE